VLTLIRGICRICEGRQFPLVVFTFFAIVEEVTEFATSGIAIRLGTRNGTSFAGYSPTSSLAEGVETVAFTCHPHRRTRIVMPKRFGYISLPPSKAFWMRYSVAGV
jgi:hypothetical protein